ncbi:ATP-binding protein [Erythrobacter crassostreae]|uniref:ATP-binding protein n=1 Tax=Erythrobacter crassostreae TaxID=2828328 RepID=A0A9X1JKR5_9SPHN|nr:ATP-binding protein [Erythrobacter crassostrea]MBV7259360.1 ATP-binding protein [Erythrobacter crassostrea]
MSEETSNFEEDSHVIPQMLAIRAMRDSGYRNTAYALAELVDNAAQAEASTIELFCEEAFVEVDSRSRKRLSRIAVLDDGVGMNASTLRKALQFGNGTRLKDRTGIGRFGMGLPNSSIAQASRVDVWSWQNGPDNALTSYIDVEEISSGALRNVPMPRAERLPVEWRNRAEVVGDTGTLVVWSDLSLGRMTWKGAKATMSNTARLIGRTHRNFIADDRLTIRMVSLDETGISDEYGVVINDPMYLRASPDLPAPFDTEPMFEKAFDETIKIDLNGTEYEVHTRYSVARAATADEADGDRGRTEYGRDADRNMGVSVLRAERELMLDRSWTIRYDPRERWWGCEVEFPAELDEIFGVTNNKQAATHFTELSELDWKDLAEDDETSISEVKERLREEGDPRGVLLELSETIKRNLVQLRNKIKTQAKPRKPGGKDRHDGDPTEIANKKWSKQDEKKPIDDGNKELSDEDEKGLDEDLEEDGRSKEKRNEILARVKSGELKVLFVEKELGGSGDLFVVRTRGSATEVIFNRLHPAFEAIFDTVSLDEDLDAMSTEDLQRRLQAASTAVHLLFAAWARMEREEASNHRTFERVRESWGKLARDFLEDSAPDGFE